MPPDPDPNPPSLPNKNPKIKKNTLEPPEYIEVQTFKP